MLHRWPRFLSLVYCAALLTAGDAAGEPRAGQDIVVVGQVRGPSGPIAQAKVEILPFTSAYEQGRLVLEGAAGPPGRAGTLSDSAGWFRLVAPESGMWRLLVSAPGYVTMEYPLAPLTEDIDVPAVELPRDSGLLVKILNERGDLIAGARVLATVPPRQSLNAPWAPRWAPGPQLQVTDAEGIARFAQAQMDALQIEAMAAGYQQAKVSAVRRKLEVRLDHGIEQRIQVRDLRLRSAMGVLVWIEGMEMPAAFSGEDGWLTLTLPIGKRARLRALSKAGEQAAADLFARPDAEKRATLDLKSASVIAGRVVALPGSQPMEGALVWKGHDFGGSARTDRRGSYQLTLDEAAPITLKAAAAGYFDETVPNSSAPLGPSIALRPKSSLSGTVVDERGRPLSDVEIRARFDRASVRRAQFEWWQSGGMSRSRKLGMFRVGRLFPGVPYTLRFAKAGFAPRIVQATAPEPGGRPEPLRVVLAPGQVARGTVVDRKNQPVAGAVVELQPVPSGDTAQRIRDARDPDPALSAQGVTDPTGRFELRDLHPGRFELSVRATGFAAGRIRGIEMPADERLVDLGTVTLVEEGVVSGRVEDSAGHPLQGVEVRVGASDPMRDAIDDDSEPDSISDAAGLFQIHGQRPGDSLRLIAELPGYARAELSGVPVPTQEPVTIVLSPASRVSGRVVDREAKPVAGVDLLGAVQRSVFLEGMVASVTQEAYRTRSQDDGSFILEGVQPGPLELTASGPEWQDSVLRIQVPLGQDLKDVEVVVNPAGTLVGQVFGPDGAPLVGAEVSRHEPLPPGMVIRIKSPLAVSDGDGRYRIRGLEPGPFRASASHSAFGQAVADVEIEPGENALDFHLRDGLTVSGRVVGPSGSPIAEVEVWLRSRSGHPAPPKALSQGDGTFQFQGIAAGSYWLDANKAGEGRTVEPVPVQVAEAPVEGVLVRLANTGTIRGHIFGLNVDELAQVRLSAGWGAGVGEARYDGTYTISDLPPGKWHVVAELPRTGRRAEGEVTLEAEEALLDLDFDKGLTLSGVVRRNGRPFAGLAVSAQAESSSPAWGETDSDGRFVLRGLTPDLYQLEISDYRSGLIHFREINLQQDRVVLLDLTTITIEGIVQRALDFEPVPSAEVTLTALGRESVASSARQAVTAADGTFLFPEIADGSWRLSVSKAGCRVKDEILAVGPNSRRIQVLLTPLETKSENPGLAADQSTGNR